MLTLTVPENYGYVPILQFLADNAILPMKSDANYPAALSLPSLWVPSPS